MVRVYLGIGSNLGEREKNIQKAISLIKKIKDVKITKFSSLYETEPVGYEKQPQFLNCALELETLLPPKKLWKELLRIEKRLGRKRRWKWHPRIIDLDILFYADKIVKNKNLIIPHPEIEKRKFVLVPLNEISSKIYHPVLKKSIKQLLCNLKKDKKRVVKLG